MNKKFLYIIVAVIIIGGFLWFVTTQRGVGPEPEVGGPEVSVSAIDSDTTISGDHTVEQGEKLVVRNSSTLTVEGNLVAQGELSCENGSLNVVVKGDLTVNGKVVCNRSEDIADSDVGSGISFVVLGSINFSENALVVTNGHLQIVDDPANLARTQDEIDAIYNEVIEDTGTTPRIGPFIEGGEGISINVPTSDTFWSSPSASERTRNFFSNILIPQALAQDVPTGREGGEVKPVRTVQISGKWFVGDPGQNPPRGLDIPTPPKKIKKIIILFNFGPGKQVNLVNFTLTGPNGRDGDGSRQESCNARGKDGGNAMRLRVRASNIKVNNFFLFPGDGGAGGEAITKKECKHGKATGGKGGNAGNIKMESSGSFVVEGTFQLWPGWGGAGGHAIAYGEDGEDGCPGEKGGDATAIGGQGGDNKKKLTIQNVEGAGNIQIGIMFAGAGGNAKARPGKGGNGEDCECDGGEGGTGVATGGKGGDAKLDLAGGVGRTAGADENGGNGGDADARGGKGGDGGDCDPSDAGGNGGKGGDATPTGGAGGSATNPGSDGDENEQGGDGGDGGDGCPEGKGGDEGIGNTLGNDGVKGEDGENICPQPKPKVAMIGIDPTDLVFEHEIGPSPCPQLAGTVSVTNVGEGAADGWQLVSEAPAWLTATDSGSLPGNAEVNFSCILEEYTTQTLETSLNFQLTHQGEPVGEPASVNVTGYIAGGD